MKKYSDRINEEKTLGEYIVLNENEFTYLNESDRLEVQSILKEFGDRKLSELDEGAMGKIFGGVAGFLIGPTIGKIIAHALGIEKGIVYDMMTSKVVNAALGASIAKYIGNGK